MAAVAARRVTGQEEGLSAKSRPPSSSEAARGLPHPRGQVGGEREDQEADARRLYESLTRNEALVWWLENRARMARAGLDTPAS